MRLRTIIIAVAVAAVLVFAVGSVITAGGKKKVPVDDFNDVTWDDIRNSIDFDNDGIADVNETDTDNDGVENDQDFDADGDGINKTDDADDAIPAGDTDANHDGVPDDLNGNGIPDYYEPLCTLAMTDIEFKLALSGDFSTGFGGWPFRAYGGMIQNFNYTITPYDPNEPVVYEWRQTEPLLAWMDQPAPPVNTKLCKIEYYMYAYVSADSPSQKYVWPLLDQPEGAAQVRTDDEFRAEWESDHRTAVITVIDGYPGYPPVIPTECWLSDSFATGRCYLWEAGGYSIVASLMYQISDMNGEIVQEWNGIEAMWGADSSVFKDIQVSG